MRALRTLFAAAATALLASCASLPQEPASLPAPPAPAPTTPATPPATPARPAPGGASFVAPDTLVSSAAAEVLASIPEPLGDPAPAGTKGARKGATPKPAPAKPAEPVGMPAPAETADSLRLAEPPPSDAPPAADTASIPVPAPTTPLGAATRPPAETPAPPAPVAPVEHAATPPAATPPQPQIAVDEEPAAAADTCWRVQVGASSQRAKATRVRSAAESQLLMRMVVERERNLWKVRTQDCVSRTTAESLKARAIASGFQGVFLVRYVKRP